jgi:hypothetical protein
MANEYEYEYEYEGEDIFLPTGRVIINNNNNNNNTIMTIKTINDDAGKTSDNQVTSVLRTPLGEDQEPSQKACRGNGSGATPPWKYIKVDLFNNVNASDGAKNIKKRKLKLNYLIPGQTSYKRVSAALDGRWRDIKKGMDLTGCKEDIDHYTKLEEVYIKLTDELTNVSASKCYHAVAKGKGNSVLGLSVVVGELPNIGHYLAAIVFNDQIQYIELFNNLLTQEQRNKNQIGTGSWGTSNTTRLRFNDFNKGE